jgi:hypothetical protein
VKNQGLTTGAQAGIGVGSGVVAIGIVGALIWFILHFRRRLRDLESAQRSAPAKSPGEDKNGEQPYVLETQEGDGTGIVREMSDNPLVEMATQPTELWADPYEDGRNAKLRE